MRAVSIKKKTAHPTTGTDRRERETQGDKRETRPPSRHHSIWPRHTASQRLQDSPGASVTASGRRDWDGRQRDKRETRPRSLGETGRQAGDGKKRERSGRELASQHPGRQAEPASQHWHLITETGRQATSGRHDAGASVRASGIQTQSGKRETRPRSQRHSAETGRHSKTRLEDTGRHMGDTTETGGRHNPGVSVTALQRLRDTGRRHTSDRRDWEHREINTRDTGRQAGDTTLESALHQSSGI